MYEINGKYEVSGAKLLAILASKQAGQALESAVAHRLGDGVGEATITRASPSSYPRPRRENPPASAPLTSERPREGRGHRGGTHGPAIPTGKGPKALVADSPFRARSPLRAIRKRCLACCAERPALVRECRNEDCELWLLRMGKGRGRYLDVLRKHCLWCANGQAPEVRRCPDNSCPLWLFRFGKRPETVGRKQPELVRGYHA